MLLAMAFSLTAMYSCKKETYNGLQATANFETLESEDNGGKLYYNGSTFMWKQSDKIGIWDRALHYQEYTAVAPGSGYSHIIDLTLSSPQPSGASTALDEKSTYYSFYPTFIVTQTTGVPSTSTGNPDPGFTVKLPHQQILDNAVATEERLAQLQLTRFPMVCKTSTTSFPYKSLCGILKLHLAQQEGKISSVKFTSLSHQQVCGSFAVTWDNKSNPVLTPLEANDPARWSVELFHDNPVDLNVAGGRDFYIYLPPNSYQGCEFTFVNEKGESCVKSFAKNTLTITRNNIKPLKFKEGTKFEYVQNNGLYTVQMTCDGQSLHRVIFSPGNLQYVNTNWQFASQQYELLHQDINNYRPDEFGSAGHEWDMFKWSTNSSSYGRSGNLYYPSDYNTSSSADFKDFGRAFGNNTWRTLSAREWFVLLYGRNTNFVIRDTSVKFIPFAIDCGEGEWTENGNTYTGRKFIPGVLLFPDNYTNAKWNQWNLGNPPLINTLSLDSKVPDGNINSNYNECLFCDKATFAQMEKDGVVFLPFTEGMWGNANHFAHYWTSTAYEQALHFDGGQTSQGTNNAAMQIYFHPTSRQNYKERVLQECDNYFTYNNRAYIQNGQSTIAWAAVRLVRDAQ